MIAPSLIDFVDRSILAFWHITDSSHPYRILICEPEVSTCELIDRLVICGTKDGSIQLWDLSEANQKNMADNTAFQRPSYSTDGIHQDHKDAINLLLVNHEPSRKSYYIKSLDCSLVCCSWIITPFGEELKTAYDLDFGMRIGSSISMRKTNSVKLTIPYR